MCHTLTTYDTLFPIPWLCQRYCSVPSPANVAAATSRIFYGPAKRFRLMSVCMGLNRVELLTPSLSEKCSNRLSYRPICISLQRMKKQNRTNPGKKQSIRLAAHTAAALACPMPRGSLFCKRSCIYKFCRSIPCGNQRGLSRRKEVIQPHLPVRLPCYDFTLLTKHTFDVVLHCWLN